MSIEISREAATQDARTVFPELPVWHLGGVGALHRRDIYNDDRWRSANLHVQHR
jgi:hypothetical protein